MSPPLVVAFALAGTVDIDLSSEPLGRDKDGKDVYLKPQVPRTFRSYDFTATLPARLAPAATSC